VCSPLPKLNTWLPYSTKPILLRAERGRSTDGSRDHPGPPRPECSALPLWCLAVPFGFIVVRGARQIVGILTVAGLLVFAAAASGANSVTYQVNPRHDGHQVGTNLDPPYHRL
jgi:hypothetical protein